MVNEALGFALVSLSQLVADRYTYTYHDALVLRHVAGQNSCSVRRISSNGVQSTSRPTGSGNDPMAAGQKLAHKFKANSARCANNEPSLGLHIVPVGRWVGVWLVTGSGRVLQKKLI